MADFAKLDVKTKRVIVHDGVGQSFWVNPNAEPAKQAAARMDWVLMVWQPANWEQLRTLPADLNPIEPHDAEKGPPAQIEVYTGGNVDWSTVILPEGVEVIDQRLQAHGFTPADGIVLEGKVIDLASQRPVAAARMRLQRIEAQPTGGYRYPVAVEIIADAQGHWSLRKAPAGTYRVVIEAQGFVPRVVGHARFDDQPHWYFYDCGLSRPAPVSGRITDEAGRPLADVEVRLDDVVSNLGARYESPQEYSSRTDANGRFRQDQIPAGHATIWLQKVGYCRPGLGQPITTPTNAVALRMMRSARVRVSVAFTGAGRPQGYIVRMEPEGGAVVGEWSGSGNIDAKNQISFDNVPPGRYVLQGQPNPSTENQQTTPLTIELKGGQTLDMTLSAK